MTVKVRDEKGNLQRCVWKTVRRGVVSKGKVKINPLYLS